MRTRGWGRPATARRPGWRSAPRMHDGMLLVQLGDNELGVAHENPKPGARAQHLAREAFMPVSMIARMGSGGPRPSPARSGAPLGRHDAERHLGRVVEDVVARPNLSHRSFALELVGGRGRADAQRHASTPSSASAAAVSSTARPSSRPRRRSRLGFRPRTRGPRSHDARKRCVARPAATGAITLARRRPARSRFSRVRHSTSQR